LNQQKLHEPYAGRSSFESMHIDIRRKLYQKVLVIAFHEVNFSQSPYKQNIRTTEANLALANIKEDL